MLLRATRLDLEQPLPPAPPPTPGPGVSVFDYAMCADGSHNPLRPGQDCRPDGCDHVFSWGPDFRLYPGHTSLTRTMRLCRANLAGRLGLTPEDIATLAVTDQACAATIGFCLILPETSCFGFHRITYDPARLWTYCCDASRPAMDPNCATPLPPAPPYEAMEEAADYIVYVTRRRSGLREGHRHPLTAEPAAAAACQLP